MKKLFLGKISLVLVFLIAILPSFTLLAKGFTEDEQNCPYIFVHGFMAVDLYENLGEDNQKVIWPPAKEDIKTAAKNSIKPILQYVKDKDWDKLSDSVIPEFRKIFKNVFLDENGNPYENTGVDFTYPEKESITKNSSLNFKYDWRLDPIESARQLDAFINYVCEASGSEKVTIMAHSCGGVIVATYARLYGTEKLQGVVLNSTAVLGETYTGELMCGNFNVNEQALKSYFEFLGYGSEYDALINTIITTFAKRGLLGSISNMFNKIFENMLDEIATELIMPMFGSWATIWAMTPDEYLEGANDYIFGKVSAATGKDYTGLRQKIENYNEQIRPYRMQTVKAMGDNCKFGVFARYGFISVPLSPTWDELSDGVIDVKYASFGCTNAKYNQVLTDEYLAEKDPEYISPNKMIDASTCLFPEKTWFIRDMKHGKPIFNLQNLVFDILYSNEDVTVNTYKSYPRFLVMDYGIYRVVPDSPIKLSLFDRLFPWVKNYFATISDIFRFFARIVFRIN